MSKLSLRAIFGALIVISTLAASSLAAAPAIAVDMSTISGTVVAHDGAPVTGNPVRVSVFALDGTLLSNRSAASTTDGSFASVPFQTQPVKLQFSYGGARDDIFYETWSGDAFTMQTASTLSVVPGSNAITVTLPRPAALTGSVVTDGSAPIGTLELDWWSSAGADSPRHKSWTLDDAHPDFRFSPIVPGTYSLQLWGSPLWKSAVIPVTVTTAGQVLVQDIHLVRAAGIEGTVTVTNATGPFDAWVSAISADNQVNGHLAADGSYVIGPLTPGSYTVCVEPSIASNLIRACLPSPVTVGPDEVVTGVNLTTSQGGGITGQLRVGSAPGGTSPDIEARVYKDDGSGFYEFVARSETVTIDGIYRFPSLEPGSYAVEFADLGVTWSSEFWEDARYFADRTDVEVEVGETIDLGLSLLGPRTLDKERLQGSDRFATSVAVTKESFADGEPVPVIYVANGLNYPDALSAGPAAIHSGGALLLVLPDGIPTVVAEELDRLNPERIVVVGSAAAISNSVKAALAEYVSSPSDVDRIGGSDRYETSRLLVRDAFGTDGAENAFIATGYNYPDALAAVPAAGYWDAPLVLVPGTASSLDSSTRTLLGDLGVQHALIAGSTAAVSGGIESGLDSYLGSSNVVRFAGGDRFETALLININIFPEAEYAFVATGLGFADALSAGPLAGALGAPMYLSLPTCMPYYVINDISAVRAKKVYFLGSTAALSNAVYNLTSCGEPTSGTVEGRVPTITQ